MMENKKHPVPWRVVQAPNKVFVVGDANDTPVFCSFDEPTARLIAAAPSLLEFVQTIAEDKFGKSTNYGPHARARALLRKIEGGE